MFAIYLDHEEEKRKTELFSGRKAARRALSQNSIRQHWLWAAFCLIAHLKYASRVLAPAQSNSKEERN